MGDVIKGNFGRPSPDAPARLDPIDQIEGLKDIGPHLRKMWMSLGEVSLTQPRALVMSKIIIRGFRHSEFERRHPEISAAEMDLRTVVAAGETSLKLGLPMNEAAIQEYEIALEAFPDGPYYIDLDQL